MKTGKTLAILIGIALVALMAFMINSEQSTFIPKTQPQEQAKTQPKEIKQEKSVELISDSELQNIKQLKESVKERDFAVSKLYLVSCAPCHGDNGKGKIAPPISSKSEAEILQKLNDYKAGNVKNSLMDGLLTNTSDDVLARLAKEISNFKK